MLVIGGDVRSLIPRFLITATFLLSLFCGSVAAGGVWGFLNLKNIDVSDAAITKSCNKQSAVGDYKKDDPSCFDEAMQATVGATAVSLFSAVIFGFVALVLLAIGIISLRKHLRTMRQAQQGAA